MKFQQITAPITAKGIEDTAFFRFNRLLSLNEVGGEPGGYGAGVRAFHADSEYRVRRWPHEMLATSTHDTKRSEDVRARLNVLSEMSTPWREAVRRWSRFNRSRRRELEGLPAPSPNDEYHFYQTLFGSWPLEEPDAAAAAYRERIEAYMIKAAREAKLRTSWTETDAAYEEALLQFVRSALEPRDSNLFLGDFVDFQRRVRRFGLLNGLSQTLLKLTSPGVPDIYQGNEIWEYSLVDPDNRRPVDYRPRREMLEALSASTSDELMQNWPDGRIKMFLTQRVLQFRREHVDLFQRGEYLPLVASGTFTECCVNFARRLGDQWIVVIAPRLSSRIGFPPIAERWKDTTLEFPETLSLEHAHNLFTCRKLRHESRRISIADALPILPFAVMTNL